MRMTLLARSVFTCLALSLAAAPLSAATLKADYHFDQDFASLIAGAPVLSYGGASPTFSTATIGGQSDRVFNFETGAGLSLSTAGLISSTSYSVALLMEFDSQSSGYQRILDPFNGGSDNGLYAYGNRLAFYQSGAFSGTTLLTANTYATIVFSFDGSNVRGYVNGVKEWDLARNAAITSAGGTFPLRFFIDDAAEHSPGSVARLQLYDGVLSDAEAISLDLTANQIPEPASLAMIAVGALAMMRRRRR